MTAHTGLDATFLKVEDADPHANFAVGALAVMEGPLPDGDALSDALVARLRTDRRFGQVVRRYPLDLAAPRVVAAGEDVSQQVHHIAVPRPGDDEALYGLISDVMSWRLHHDHPLWECWIVEGLSDGRWAILLKTHSSIVDEVDVMRTLMRLSDDGDADGQPQGSTRLSVRTLNPLKLMGGMWRSSAALTTAAVRAVTDATGLTAGRDCPAVSKCGGHATGLHRYAAVELSSREVTKVCDAFGVTVKDIALAAMGKSYRDLLMGHGRQQQRCDSLRALVSDSAGSLAAIALPVDEPDPVQRLRTAHGRLTGAGYPGAPATNRLPRARKAQPIRAPGLSQREVVALTTNETGPRGRLRFMGRDAMRLLPIPAVGRSVRTGVAVVGYADRLTIGITSDLDALPDIGELARSIEQTVARLLAISTSARRTNDKNLLYLIPSEPVPTLLRGRQRELATTR